MQCIGELSFGQEVTVQGGRLDGRHRHDHRQPDRRQATLDFLSESVGQHVLHRRHKDVGHRLVGSAPRDEGHCGVDSAGQVREKDLILARKVVEECLRGNPCGGGDLGDRGPLVAILLEQPHGRPDQLLAGLLSLAFAQAHLVGRLRPFQILVTSAVIL